MKGQISPLIRLSVNKPMALAVIVCGLLGMVRHLAVAQGQNEIEEVKPHAPLIGVTSPTGNPLQIALLHWYNANLTTTFGVGANPRGVAFDGANIWVVNNGSNDVTKLRANDGAVLGTFGVGTQPVRAAFDGANVWVTNNVDNTVSKL